MYRTLIPTLVLAANCLAACSGAARPCAGANGCPNGSECLAARCVRAGTFPVDPRAARWLLKPTEMAIARREAPSGVAPSITLGNQASAPNALYLSFPAVPRGHAITSAFLLFERAEGSLQGPDVELEVRRVAESWRGPGFAWADRPNSEGPEARGIGRSAPPLPVRIDVTELARFAARHPSRDHGYVVEAASAGGSGITLSTGLDGGTPPRLDVYVAPAP